MSYVVYLSSGWNETDLSCPRPLLWTPSALSSRKARLIVCIIAACIHLAFWLQLVVCPSLRHKTMQWLYAYLISDGLLLFRFFFIYVVYVVSTECQPNENWVLFMYYFEATMDNYLNILEAYILLALNICRYVQIAYKCNVYRVYGKLLILIHLSIYILPLMFLFVPFFLHWSQLEVAARDYCQVMYNNVYVQAFNVIFAFVLPISLNILVIYRSVRHVRLTNSLRQTRHYVSAREKYNRSLVIQFLAFYIIWLALWSPNVIVYQISIGSSELTGYVRLLNFIEIALDPVIIAALDVRFWQEWRKVFTRLTNTNLLGKSEAARIHPLSVNVQAASGPNPRPPTTTI